MNVLGIDLAKLSFDATLLTATGSQHYASFSNSAGGFTQLQAWLAEHDVSDLHACMEATNIYWEALASWLHAHSYTVSVVNPARIKGFAQATMQRNKTDKLDSAVMTLRVGAKRHRLVLRQAPADGLGAAKRGAAAASRAGAPPR